MSKRALVVIDLQNDYFPGGRWTLHGIDAAADNAARAIAAARDTDDVLIHVRHEFPSEDAPFFTPGSDGAKIHEKVQPKEGEPVVLKNHVNAFKETNLQEMLQKEDVKDVTFVGAMSHMCIDAAVRAASDLGYNVTVLHDACASRDVEFGDTVIPAEQAHAAYMHSLGFAYAQAVSTDDYLKPKE